MTKGALGKQPQQFREHALFERMIVALAQDDFDSYSKCFFNKEALKDFFLVKKKIVNPGQEHKKFLDSITADFFPEYIKEIKTLYDKFKNSSLKIDWKTILLDSIAYKKTENEFIRSGTIYLKTMSYSQFYKINFNDMLSNSRWCLLSTTFLPYFYIGPKNRILTSNLKQKYIDTCLSHILYAKKTYPDSLYNLIYGRIICEPCFCEMNYFSATDQTDGILRVKNYISFVMPRKPDIKLTK